jgi:hypothetical protein
MKTNTPVRKYAPTDCVVPSFHQTSLNLSGKEVILHKENGVYFGLNESGTMIWELIKTGKKSVSELKAFLLEHFEISENQCEEDLTQLLHQMHEEGLIEIVG